MSELKDMKETDVNYVHLAYERSLRNKSVVISNAIVRAAQGLTLAEKRIAFCAIAKIEKALDPIKITAQEYSKTFGLPLNQSYEQLKGASENFWNRYLSLEIQNDGKKEHYKIRWISSFAYQNGDGYVIINFAPEVLPYVFDLKENFTKYKLQQSWALRSMHSWRLLELIEQMNTNKDNSGWLRISVDKFHHAMESPPSYRRSFAVLRTKVIEPAIKELSEKDGWDIKWTFTKKGRKVDMLDFSFKKRDRINID